MKVIYFCPFCDTENFVEQGERAGNCVKCGKPYPHTETRDEKKVALMTRIILRRAFPIALDGHTGEKYTRCVECNATTDNGDTDPTHVKHTYDCSIGEALE